MSGCLHPVSPGCCVPGLCDTCNSRPLCSVLTITSREGFLIPHNMIEAGHWARPGQAARTETDRQPMSHT